MSRSYLNISIVLIWLVPWKLAALPEQTPEACGSFSIPGGCCLMASCAFAFNTATAVPLYIFLTKAFSWARIGTSTPSIPTAIYRSLLLRAISSSMVPRTNLAAPTLSKQQLRSPPHYYLNNRNNWQE